MTKKERKASRKRKWQHSMILTEQFIATHLAYQWFKRTGEEVNTSLSVLHGTYLFTHATCRPQGATKSVGFDMYFDDYCELTKASRDSEALITKLQEWVKERINEKLHSLDQFDMRQVHQGLEPTAPA